MDKLTAYRKTICKRLSTHAKRSSSYDAVETLFIEDAKTDNYLLMSVGWGNDRRVHNVTIHVRLKDDKVWIEWDGTDPGIATELVQAGIPKEDIVLAFYRPERRLITEFATG